MTDKPVYTCLAMGLKAWRIRSPRFPNGVVVLANDIYDASECYRVYCDSGAAQGKNSLVAYEMEDCGMLVYPR